MKLVTKRVEIEAVQWLGNNVNDIKAWMTERFEEQDHARMDPVSIAVFVPRKGRGMTNELWKNIADDNWTKDITAAVWDYLHETYVGVKNGQWIICGLKGEFYPCDDETLWAKYKELKPYPDTGENAGEHLARLGTDGLAWAEDFVKHVEHGLDPTDIGWVVGWFANAIEAGKASVHGKMLFDHDLNFEEAQAIKQRFKESAYASWQQKPAVLGEEGVEISRTAWKTLLNIGPDDLVLVRQPLPIIDVADPDDEVPDDEEEGGDPMVDLLTSFSDDAVDKAASQSITKSAGKAANINTNKGSK